MQGWKKGHSVCLNLIHHILRHSLHPAHLAKCYLPSWLDLSNTQSWPQKLISGWDNSHFMNSCCLIILFSFYYEEQRFNRGGGAVTFPLLNPPHLAGQELHYRQGGPRWSNLSAYLNSILVEKSFSFHSSEKGRLTSPAITGTRKGQASSAKINLHLILDIYCWVFAEFSREGSFFTDLLPQHPPAIGGVSQIACVPTKHSNILRAQSVITWRSVWKCHILVAWSKKSWSRESGGMALMLAPAS